MMRHLFIFGLGYSAMTIAREAMRQGFTVSGTTRCAEKAAMLAGLGIKTYRLEPGFVMPEGVTHILSSLPTGEVDALSWIADASDAWLGYLSTTGVYGDWDGAWVDETSPLRGQGDRLSRRIDAEIRWLARGGHVFRLAGIYGPGRSALDDIHDGTARRIDKPGQVFSRIHVDDIAQTVLASMRHPQPGNVYNVCDDAPVPAHEVVAYAAQLLGVNPPALIPFEQAVLSPMGREFYASNRRVNNAKIKRELKVMLRYPTYREGLAQCLQCQAAE